MDTHTDIYPLPNPYGYTLPNRYGYFCSNILS
jgi:hypothetical protein